MSHLPTDAVQQFRLYFATTISHHHQHQSLFNIFTLSFSSSSPLFTLNCSVYSRPKPTIHHKTVPGVRLQLDEDEDEDEEMNSTHRTTSNEEVKEGRRKIGLEVKLLSVDLDTEGIYRCVATTEGIFENVRQQMTVAVFSEYTLIKRLSFLFFFCFFPPPLMTSSSSSSVLLTHHLTLI